jgi:hypothetical protein
MKGSQTSLPSLPARRPRPVPAPTPAAAPAAPAPIATSTPAATEPKQSNVAKAAAGAAAVAAGAAAAAAATTAASATPAYTEPDSAVLKEAADAAVKDTTDAIAAGNATAAAQAAETMEDVVDDQIALTNESAVEAVVGLIDAAVDAEEAANDAEDVLQHAEKEKEEAAAVPAVVEEEVAAVAAAEEASDDELPALVPAPAVVAEEKKEEEVVAKPAETKSAGPSLPAKKKNGNKKNSGGASKPAAEPKPKKETSAPAAPSAAALAAAAAEIEELTREEIPAIVAAESMPDEADDEVETLDQLPHPTLDFSQAPENDAPMNEVEEKIRQMSLAAHKLIKDNQNKIAQATKDQGAALDLALGPEGTGKVRPSLVAACAFALSDMQVAQRQISETKASLAVAYDAAQRLEGQNATVRALTNYAYVLRNARKPKSARLCYAQAIELAKKENGISSSQVEQIKYEYTGFLAKAGRIEEAVKLLSEEADVLLAEGERLDKEVPSEEEQKKIDEEEAKKKAEEAALADPGSGLDHIAAEQEAAAEAENQGGIGKALLPNDQARHFAMRNLLHSSELMDALGKFEEGEAALGKAMEVAIAVHGENSIPHMNCLYALGAHYRRQGRIEDSIAAHESVLNIMDDTIEVYEPDLLQNRISILRDTAILYDKAGDPATAIDYATGALVNAQTLAKIMAQMPGTPPGMTANMLEPFWFLLAGLKAKAGDAEGAAEAKREALRGKLNQGLASRGGRSAQQRGGASGGGSKQRTTANGASSTRAGGRRV